MSEPMKSFAIIIAIEDYRFSEESVGITAVKYARNDAVKFKKMLIEDFGMNEEDIILWTDKDATKSAFENELKYYVRHLTKDTRFYFYYAGHGFYQNGHNKLTCWDTHPSNLDGTTVSIKEVLLDPLEKSECTQSLFFLDCCSTHLKETIETRDLISNFNYKELDDFLKTDKYHAIFMSCSPGEKSYPNDFLKHGIWTWHLIDALKGNAKDAILKDQYITDSTLKNYLSHAVPSFITTKTTLKDTQTPYTKINTSSDFIIRQLPLPSVEFSKDFPKLSLQFQSAVFRRIDSIDIRGGSGFKKGHFAPIKSSSSANNFIQAIFTQELSSEIQEIYENTKEILSLRKRQIEYGAEDGYGKVENEVFRFSIEVEQNPKIPDQAFVTRTLQIRVSRDRLPENFDDIFPKQIDEILIPIVGEIDFDELVEKFENLEDEDGGKLSDNELEEKITYKTHSGLTIIIKLKTSELIISPNRHMKCLELIDSTIEGLSKISTSVVKLLN